MFNHILWAAVVGVGMMLSVGTATATARQPTTPIRSARMPGNGAGAAWTGNVSLPERATVPIRGLDTGAATSPGAAALGGRLPNPFGPYPYPMPSPYPYPYPYPYPPVTPYGWWPMPYYGIQYQINIPYYPPGMF